ncbi:hypothetical protein BLOT_006328 [Blomia tropicalis]|nr:hypothetical protein BLOT_006328 [Blomia tropicalis]
MSVEYYDRPTYCHTRTAITVKECIRQYVAYPPTTGLRSNRTDDDQCSSELPHSGPSRIDHCMISNPLCANCFTLTLALALRSD